MNSREFNFTHAVTFENGAMILAEDDLGKWIVNAGRGLNDLLIARRRVMVGFDTDTSQHEQFYDIKALTVHAWELADYFRATERTSTVVAEFVAGLDDEEARDDYRVALKALKAPAPEEAGPERPFHASLAIARNQSTHYSKLDTKHLAPAIERIAGQKGEFLFGPRYIDAWADFAADIDAQLYFPMKDDPQPFRRFSEELLEVVNGLIRFCRVAISHYLNDRGELTTLEELPPSREPQTDEERVLRTLNAVAAERGETLLELAAFLEEALTSRPRQDPG